MSEGAARTVPGGLVIFFEGVDGVGKTTQLEMAAESLRDDGWAVQTSRAHGGTPLGEELRKVSLMSIDRAPETNLYISMAIHEELGHQVADWRQQGAITLIDRGPLSMAAYQIYADGCDPEIGWREVQNDVERFGAEIIILYTAALDIALKRAGQRGDKADYFAEKSRSYFEKVEQGYADSGRRFDATVIDAEQSLEAVHTATMRAIRRAIESKAGE